MVKIVYLWLSDGDGCLSVIQLSRFGPMVSEGLRRKTSVTVKIVQIASHGSSLGSDNHAGSTSLRSYDRFYIRHISGICYAVQWYGLIRYGMVCFWYAIVLYGILLFYDMICYAMVLRVVA